MTLTAARPPGVGNYLRVTMGDTYTEKRDTLKSYERVYTEKGEGIYT